jgi:putative thioredoxin
MNQMIIGGDNSPDEELVKDGTDASFIRDVVEASRSLPVLVDFWAPWCGPCKQLGPVLERTVQAAGGKVRLVKINIDTNPAYAGQLRVQSIPAVFAFKNGQPVDAFMGALPPSEIEAFVAKQIGEPAAQDKLDKLFELAAESMQLGDMGGAAQAYAAILQAEPDNERALAGMARIYLDGGDAERAAEIIAMAAEDSADLEVAGVRAALNLAGEAPDNLGALTAEIQADPDNFEARVGYARALAGAGDYGMAMEQLFTILERDPDWNDGAARTVLLELFEAAGPTSELTRAGRRRLSSILYR